MSLEKQSALARANNNGAKSSLHPAFCTFYSEKTISKKNQFSDVHNPSVR